MADKTNLDSQIPVNQDLSKSLDSQTNQDQYNISTPSAEVASPQTLSIELLNEHQSKQQLEELEKQMDEFRYKVMKYHSPVSSDDITSLQSMYHAAYYDDLPSTKSATRKISEGQYVQMDQSYKPFETENKQLKQQIDQLRRDYNKLILEDAYLKKENKNYEQRLKDETKIRTRLQIELKRLIQTMDLNESNNDNNGVEKSTLMENTEHLIQQLNTCRDDFYDEKKEKEQYKKRNMQLEKQLEEAKQMLEKQEKKILLYASLVEDPILSQVELPVIPRFKRPQNHLTKEKQQTQYDTRNKNTSNNNNKQKDNAKDRETFTNIEHGADQHIIKVSLSSESKIDYKRENIYTLSPTRLHSPNLAKATRPSSSASSSYTHRTSPRASMNGTNTSLLSPTERRPLPELPIYSPPSHTSSRRSSSSPNHQTNSPTLSSVSSAFTYSDFETEFFIKNLPPSSAQTTSVDQWNNSTTLCYPSNQ